MNVERWRDLTLIALPQDHMLVVACDSAGAVGPKPLDQLQVPGEIVGRFTARVPLMEVLSVGAEPMAIIDTLSVEPIPTGAAIRCGIAQELLEAGLDPSLLLNGSEEKNFPTLQTGVGVTVIGLATTTQLRRGLTAEGDLLCVVGQPHVGSDVLTHPAATADIATVRWLTTIPGVHEIVPVGSKGVRGEVEAVFGSWSIHWSAEEAVPMAQSAGPATCLLVAIAPNALPQLLTLSKPVNVIASLAVHPSNKHDTKGE